MSGCSSLVVPAYWGASWTSATILRATEFHDLMLMFLMRLSKGPVAVVPRNSLFQPVDAGDVAERMAELVTGLRPAAFPSSAVRGSSPWPT